ncbi:structural protein [Synechococcus phage S-MS29]|nr:structural protein [Synechococcus phage S-MS29]
MANRIQLRRGGAQEWANANPTLAQGELGIELDTGRIKIGDGVTAWSSLRYERPIESTSNTANTLVQRDADGNFAAGTITSTLIGNASTASRLASTRQITLAQDVTGTGLFDGSANLNINASLELISSLPHYDGTVTPTAEYTKVTVDAKGRIINASNPTTLADYNLNGTVEGQSAQPYDLDLVAVAGLTTTGLISRTSGGNMATRTITGTATRIAINDGGGISGNPTIDLITTAVVAGDYNTESLTSVSALGGNNEPFGTETVNAAKFTVDAYGRLTSATNVPIATATEGSKYAIYNAGTAYSRYDIIENASKVYQAITSINAGAGAPTHSSGDTGGWRYLAAAATEQKGLASFAQEDFDVDGNGHVTIAALGVDNTQLQNNRVSFADGNTKEDFELDQELTATTGYRGFNYLNYVKVNDTSGNLLFGANNTGDSGAGEVDINVRSYFSDPDITLDGAVAQTLDKTGDGNLTFQTTQNSASARSLSILATNAGSGTSNVIVTAEDTVQISASNAAAAGVTTTGKILIEDLKVYDNYIASGNATINIDPGDSGDNTGTVRVWGDLQVDGTTTTVNSTTLQVDDPIITLGGDTAPSADDNLDRGVEFRYYDTQARLGFYGWDTNYTDLGGHEGGYRFLHAATNTSEVFTGTDSGIIAGNVKLTTNTNSTSNTTGDLVVAGGAGIGQDVNIGGLVDIDSTLRVHSTSRFDDNMVIQGASKTLQLNNGSGTTKVEFQSTTGNGSLAGILDVTGNFNVNTDKFNVVATSGNTSIAGTLGVTGGTTLTGALDLNNTLNVSGLVYFENVDEPTIALNSGTGLYEIGSSDYGSFRFDGGGYVEGDTLYNSDVYINGQIIQKEDTTANYNRQNYLEVRYKLRSGTRAVYTPSYATHDTSNLRVYGGAGIATTLHVGGTGSGEGLFVGKEYSGDTVKFSVLGASGNTDIQGTLDVAGNTEINGTLDVDADFAVRNGTTDKFTVDNVTGNTVIEGTLNGKGAADFDSTLNVDGNTTLGGTLTVTGTTEFNNTVDVDANFAVRSGSTDKFTVASSSGNVATDGTLVVQGQTTINDSLIVDAANEVFSIRNGSAVEKFGVDADNGNTNIIGTLTVGDATQINDTLGASGIVTLTNNTDQTLTGNYGADGALRLTGGAAIQRNLAVGGNMRVYGDFEISGSTTQSGNTGFSGRVSITNTSDATSFSDNSVALTTDGGLRVSKNAWVGGDFYVWDDANSRNAFYVDTSTGDATLHNTLTVGGDLVVNGTTTTVNSTVTTLDDPIITLGGDTAPASNDGKDRGVEFRYYDGSAKVGFFGFDRSSSQYTFLVDATNNSEIHTGTDAALRAGSLNLTGSGTSLDVDANANIDGTLTVDGQIISQVSSGPALVIPTTAKINNLNADLLDSMTTASAATPTTVVNRDSSGDFAANIITVASGTGAGAGIQGNALTADTLKTARTITIDGVVDGSVSFNGSADVTISTVYNDADITALAAMAGTGFVTRTAANTYAQRTLQVTASSGITLTNADGVSGDPTINVASASTNSANNLVLRDASGNFAANEITADLVGNVTGNVTGNVVGNVTGQTSDISNHDTDALTEGSTNLYFTNERVDDRIDALFVASTGITKVYDDAAGTYTLSVTQADIDTDNVTEGSTNLFTTAARTRTHFTYGTGIELSVGGELSVTQADIDTDNVTEGSTNIFYTEARFDASLAGKTTTDLAEGTNLYFTDARADARIAAATTDDLTEGSTNQYYTEARVQDKLDNAYEQLRAMLNNLAAATTLVLNLSGDPTPGDVTALDAGTLVGGTGYNTATAVATTSSGSGAGLTVDITASGGVITAVAINADGSGYAVGDTITITGGGGDATIDVSAVVEMAVGDTVTGGTSGTTGVITAVGATSVTVDNVDGFFKKTETVSAGDVSTLTIQSFG